MKTIIQNKENKHEFVYKAKIDGNIVKITLNGSRIATNFKPREEYRIPYFFNTFYQRNRIRQLKIAGLNVIEKILLSKEKTKELLINN